MVQRVVARHTGASAGLRRTADFVNPKGRHVHDAGIEILGRRALPQSDQGLWGSGFTRQDRARARHGASMKPLHFVPCTLAVGAVLCASGVFAQAAPSNGSASSDELGDIIVTAEKRSESIQRVPLSIVAYGGEALAEVGAQDFSSLAARIP